RLLEGDESKVGTGEGRQPLRRSGAEATLAVVEHDGRLGRSGAERAHATSRSPELSDERILPSAMDARDAKRQKARAEPRVSKPRFARTFRGSPLSAWLQSAPLSPEES